MEITTRPRSRRWRRLAGWSALLTAVLALCVLAPASLGLSQHVVTDNAMGGGMSRGALVLDRPVESADQLAVGDVITLTRPDASGDLVARRVVAIEGSRVLTRGDTMSDADPWVLDLATAEASRTVFAVPFAGYPQLLVPWLTWTLLAVLGLLATLAAVVAARREAARNLCTVRPAGEGSAAAAA